MRPAFGLLVVLLAGCAGPDLSTPQGQCEEQAEHDPEYERIVQLRTSGFTRLYQDLLPDERDAKAQAVRRCLQGKGLAPPGGVERPNRVR